MMYLGLDSAHHQGDAAAHHTTTTVIHAETDYRLAPSHFFLCLQAGRHPDAAFSQGAIPCCQDMLEPQ